MPLPETRTTPMPPRPGAVAIAAILSGFDATFACGFLAASDIPLLGNGKDVVNNGVQHQPGWEEEEHYTKYNGHNLHQLGLQRIRWQRIEFTLDQHAYSHNKRQD